MPTSLSEDEWKLAVDAQAQGFLEMKQKLTYFLITATAAAIAFVVNYVGSRKLNDLQLALLALSAVSGLAGAGCALLNLDREHRSHSLHLRYRTQRKDFGDLTATEQCAWDGLNQWAKRLRSGAFALLFFQFATAVSFFIVLLTKTGGTA